MPGKALTGTADQASAPLAATSGADRIDALDLIRGVAVIGIVFANIMAFGQPFSASFYPGAFLVAHGPSDDLGWLVQFVLIDGKMRGLFTVLFGAGLVLFVERARAKGSGAGLQLRRLAWLLCFGAAHFVLLWRGDILMSYAIAGAIALLFLHRSGRSLLVIGLLGYAAGALILTAAYALPDAMVSGELAGDPANAGARSGLVEAAEAALAKDMEEGATIRDGDYLSFVHGNATMLGEHLGVGLLLTLLETVPLVLTGMGLIRSGFFSGTLDRRRLLLWSTGGVIAGGAATLMLGLEELEAGFSYYGTLSAIAGASMLPRLPMVLGYAGLLVLADGRFTGIICNRVRAAGRMAFSNYLGTSFLMLWVFHGFGLGLFGVLDRVELHGVAAATGLVMLLWSQAWLKRFRYGPLEWAWRCLTYGRIFPLRR